MLNVVTCSFKNLVSHFHFHSFQFKHERTLTDNNVNKWNIYGGNKLYCVHFFSRRHNDQRTARQQQFMRSRNMSNIQQQQQQQQQQQRRGAGRGARRGAAAGAGEGLQMDRMQLLPVPMGARLGSGGRGSRCQQQQQQV